MKHALIIGVLTVIILALLFALKAFAFVFVLVFQYGLYALVVASILYLWWRATRKPKDNENK